MVDGLVVDVARGATFDAPLVLLHSVAGGAAFPRTFVRLAEGSSVSVVELFTGGDADTLSVPVTELSIGDGAVLRYGSIQLLAVGSWHLATVSATVGRDGTVTQLTAGLGATYDRIRTDVVLAGQGASSVLRSTYLGTGDQIHDLRTLQDHSAPRTVSDLLCKGAVDDDARSVYSGVIKVRHGAIRSDARQTNHNLVLSPSARADSVPNLDIEENDVRCSHASTVGPLDADQRYYLESRGISPDVAEGLLVRGFFRDLLEKAPISTAADLVRSEIEGRLA
jgi:Fe-S cluster assembly protein SufD